jgi:hypothetical protein
MYSLNNDCENSKSKNNSCYEDNMGGKFNLEELRKYFILIFAVFSIVLPVGTLPGICNPVFAQANFNSIDDTLDENGNMIASKSIIKEKDRIHSTPENAYSIENIITQEDISNSISSSSSSSSQSGQSVQAESVNEFYGDFNGDGFDDLAIIVPGESVDIGGVTIGDAGAVEVIYGSSAGLSATSPRPDQFWTQSSPDVNDQAEQSDLFGLTVSMGDFNGDGRDDLAIGVPNEDLDIGGVTISHAGAVNVLYGSSAGLSASSPRPDQFWTQDTADVNDVSEEGDAFGRSLTSGDFNGDGRDDLAIGVLEDVVTGAGTQNNAGAVSVLYGSSSGLSATTTRPDQMWTQSTADVNDLSETGDGFGASLSSGDFNGDGRDDLAIGVSGEDLVIGAGTQQDAGAVNILYGSSAGLSATSPRPDQFWTQSTADVNDLSESGDAFGFPVTTGDFNGDGMDDLAIGVQEDVITGAGTQNDAGAVNVLYGSSTGLSATSPRPDQFWTQSTADVNDLSESGDFFGRSLSAGDFNGDGRDDLAVGVLLEDVDLGAGNIINAGAVNVLYGSSAGLSATSPRPDQFWTQSTEGVNDLSELEDLFGEVLYSGDFNGDGRDDLGISVGFEDFEVGGVTINDAGAVNVLYGSSTGISATSPRPDQFWTQSTEGVNDLSENTDFFGGRGD